MLVTLRLTFISIIYTVTNLLSLFGISFNKIQLYEKSRDCFVNSSIVIKKDITMTFRVQFY